jgi:hypothetical protein
MKANRVAGGDKLLLDLGQDNKGRHIPEKKSSFSQVGM